MLTNPFGDNIPTRHKTVLLSVSWDPFTVLFTKLVVRIFVFLFDEKSKGKIRPKGFCEDAVRFI